MVTTDQITYLETKSKEYETVLTNSKLVSIPLDYLQGLSENPVYTTSLHSKVIKVQEVIYLLLFMSGGVDSFYMLYSFDSNGTPTLVNQLGFEIDDEEHWLSEREVILKLLNQ